MDTTKRSTIDRLLFATFLKGRTSSRDVWEEKGETPEDNQKIIEETNEIINDDSTYPFISYLSDLLAKSKPSDDAVKKLHDCIDKVAVALGHDSTDVFRALLAKLIEQPEEKQTFDRLLEMAENLAAKHWRQLYEVISMEPRLGNLVFTLAAWFAGLVIDAMCGFYDPVYEQCFLSS